jgi:hypothetical protein
MKSQSLIHVLIAVICFRVLPQVQAVVPPPDGGYPNFTTAEGDNALRSLTSGVGNTAIGTFSLFSVTTGNFNTAVGAGSLDLNVGDLNTASGTAALLFNTTGTGNTALGAAALEFNNRGHNNNAVGAFALFNNDSSGNGNGNFNNAFGHNALTSNSDGYENEAFGDETLLQNVLGFGNIAIGDSALIDSSGNENVAVGKAAGGALTVANNVIAIGANVSGVDTVLGEVSDSCYIGNIYTGTVPAAGNPQIVFVDPDGKFGTQTVDAAGNKFQIPVSALQSFMSQGVPQHEVPLTPAKQAMLERKVEQLQTTVAKLTQQLKEQAAQIQKVSTRLEMSKPAAKTVSNP